MILKRFFLISMVQFPNPQAFYSKLLEAHLRKWSGKKTENQSKTARMNNKTFQNLSKCATIINTFQNVFQKTLFLRHAKTFHNVYQNFSNYIQNDAN